MSNKDNLIDDPWAEDEKARADEARRQQSSEGDDLDFEDLTPMSGAQKLRLFVVILGVVIVFFIVLTHLSGI